MRALSLSLECECVTNITERVDPVSMVVVENGVTNGYVDVKALKSPHVAELSTKNHCTSTHSLTSLSAKAC